MSYHPFPLYIPLAGEASRGADLSSAEMCRRFRIQSFCEMSDRLKGIVSRFNESNAIEVRKKEIEHLGFWRGVHFPEIGKVLHPHRIGIINRVIPQRFIVSKDHIVIQSLKDLSQTEYEDIMKFPLNMITLDLKLELDKEKLEKGRGHEFIITVLWQSDPQANPQ
jgi:hypothetical protein